MSFGPKPLSRPSLINSDKEFSMMNSDKEFRPSSLIPTITPAESPNKPEFIPPSQANGYSPPVPTPGNSHNEITAAEARERKARGRLATIYTSNYGISPNSTVSLSRKMLQGY